ncbi:glycosyl hydrolase family 31 [Lasius niger]|uniref:Glycosyl hydrolase family 31 n=1 Tax=Lasius niger TaxID=67767 RepID=A0A0J7KLN5_LASNI|nr:glycosyl hydrolase family 31 [Lasius niger]
MTDFAHDLAPLKEVESFFKTRKVSAIIFHGAKGSFDGLKAIGKFCFKVFCTDNRCMVTVNGDKLARWEMIENGTAVAAASKSAIKIKGIILLRERGNNFIKKNRNMA